MSSENDFSQQVTAGDLAWLEMVADGRTWLDPPADRPRVNRILAALCAPAVDGPKVETEG